MENTKAINYYSNIENLKFSTGNMTSFIDMKLLPTIEKSDRELKDSLFSSFIKEQLRVNITSKKALRMNAINELNKAFLSSIKDDNQDRLLQFKSSNYYNSLASDEEKQLKINEFELYLHDVFTLSKKQLDKELKPFNDMMSNLYMMFKLDRNKEVNKILNENFGFTLTSVQYRNLMLFFSKDIEKQDSLSVFKKKFMDFISINIELSSCNYHKYIVGITKSTLKNINFYTYEYVENHVFESLEIEELLEVNKITKPKEYNFAEYVKKFRNAKHKKYGIVPPWFNDYINSLNIFIENKELIENK